MKRFLFMIVALGVIDPTCTQENICTPGYTKTVRPPASYTNALKRAQMKAFYFPGDPSQYEEDHIISLELCGAPRDPANLIPELWPQARKKDVIETRFHRAVCHGAMTLEDAQNQIGSYE